MPFTDNDKQDKF